jgi:galactonate dehydratase
MKIDRITTYLMQAGSPEGRSWAADGTGYPMATDRHGRTYESRGRNWLFVRIDTDDGIHGTGECSGWPRVVERAVQDLASVLVGEDPFDIERLWQKMMATAMHHGVSGVVGGGAMSGIDMALWDIKGKALGTPVWNLLGGRMRERIRLYGHASSADVAIDLVERGFTAIKTGGLANPLAKAQALRRAIGAEVDLMVDLYGPPWMTTTDAIRLTRALEDCSLLFCEDPVAPENLEGFARLRSATTVPIAAGERMSTLWGFRPLIERELVDVVQPDTGRAGGISQMRKIAAMAEAHFIQVAPHSGTLGPVAEFAALHVLASIPNALILERIEDDWSGRYEVVEPVLRSADGHLAIPDSPGLGVELVEEAIARYPSECNVASPDTRSGSYLPGTAREYVYYQHRSGRKDWFTPPSGESPES